MPMKRILANVFVQISKQTGQVSFTRQQIYKLNRTLFHPSVDKLFSHIPRSKLDGSHTETRRILDYINHSCGTFQRIQMEPWSFRVSVGSENMVLNELLLLDVMYIESAPILHIVDESTNFSADRFLPNVSTTKIWSVLLQFLYLIYTGLLNRIIVIQCY